MLKIQIELDGLNVEVRNAETDEVVANFEEGDRGRAIVRYDELVDMFYWLGEVIELNDKEMS